MKTKNQVTSNDNLTNEETDKEKKSKKERKGKGKETSTSKNAKASNDIPCLHEQIDEAIGLLVQVPLPEPEHARTRPTHAVTQRPVVADKKKKKTKKKRRSG
jgi:hypothetical protein